MIHRQLIFGGESVAHKDTERDRETERQRPTDGVCVCSSRFAGSWRAAWLQDDGIVSTP